MVFGEPGVGKKLFARIIHNEGKRGLAPYFVINCKGVDESTLRKNIFGKDGAGSKLEQCVGGTIVFEEIGFMPLPIQLELIQILTERRIPGSHIIIDVRPIFTTSKNIKLLIEEEGSFNPDLYHYMCSSEVIIDPLRKRPHDVADLLSFCLRKECRKQGLLLKDFSESAKEQLVNYAWPGNVSELEKAVEKAVLYNPKAHIISDLGTKSTPIIDVTKTANCLLENIPHADDSSISLKDRVALVEREMILSEIKRHKGNKSKAATSMGISREALRKKMLMSDEILEQLKAGKKPVSAVGDEKKAA
jgi:Nif-specific regulatory protein